MRSVSIARVMCFESSSEKNESQAEVAEDAEYMLLVSRSLCFRKGGSEMEEEIVPEQNSTETDADRVRTRCIFHRERNAGQAFVAVFCF